ncbi:iron ABC transporter permease [Psittacicella hinzii]|uniref:Iron complex transport system permease protein n=1 Tax=Psittacicella hinzii TaxID=2028575 RepID=A0A3A1YK42_9GAMM|nr:iron ABC transporter permease [Psittacicella hinzii]RIY37951.1 hypothetical protein CKF58_04385 [Psittacicella hinzii]
MVKPKLGLIFAILAVLILLLGTWVSYVTLERTYTLDLQSSLDLPFLLWFNYSLPRMTMAMLAGLALGVSTVLLQQITRNNLAADNTLAVSAGAQLSLLIATIFFPILLVAGASIVAFIGALIALLLVFVLVWHKLGNSLSIILSGMVISLYLFAISAILLLIYPEQTRGILVWAAGSLVQDSWLDSQVVFLQLAIALIVVAFLAKGFNMLSLDQTNALQLGVPVRTLRLVGMVLAAYLAAIIVAKVGMLGFIGIMASAIVRYASRQSFYTLLWATPLMSAVLLLITDLTLQLINHYLGWQIPTGAVTSLVGTPILLYLMCQHRANASQLMTQQHRRVQIKAKHLTLMLIALFGVGTIIMALSWDKGNLYLSQLLTLRLPSLVASISAGILLALAGLVLQRLSYNPLASPELLGISASVNLGIMASIILASATSYYAYMLGGIIGAVLCLALLLLFSWRNKVQPEKIILLGISIAALYDAANRIFLATNDFRAYTLLQITSGSTYHLILIHAIVLLALAVLALVLVLFWYKWLRLLALRTTIAQAVGLSLKLTNTCFILFAAIITAIATLNIGAISFVGLIAPHAARALGYVHPRGQTIATVIITIAVMSLSYLASINLIYPYTLPVGLMSTLIGGLYFAYLVRKL